MVAVMIAMPIISNGYMTPVITLKHDLGEFFEQHQQEKYVAYEDYQSGYMICEMDPQLELVFILKHPQYQRYQVA